MRGKRIFSLLLAGLLALAGTIGVYAGTEDQIADMQAQREIAQAGLAQAQSHISSLEGKKQELEAYLGELNAQYEELTNSLSQLSIQAAEKEEALKELKLELKRAEKQSEKQYEAMKKRIVYLYEKGGASMLELLLSSADLSQFLNRAENISQISAYDREMLQKYQELQASIQSQKDRLQQEYNAVNGLLAERGAKRQEVQEMVAATSESIQSYVRQISASQEEASALLAQVSIADDSIASLMAQAEREAAEAVSQEAWEEQTYQEYDVTETGSSQEAASDEEESWEAYPEEAYEETYEDTYEEEPYEEEAYTQEESQGSGSYLGNFTLTAYCNCAQCCGTAGNLTASGTVPAAGRTVAMAGVPFGTQLLINGNVYTVEDLGTPYGHVDIYFGSHEEALGFGLQSAEVYQVG
ncbi:MAG: hypothetical protein Q4D55_02140 [Eubacteriales bacterium]|nr:hypothetical protein [Eubacteriales bacterium]